jgi:hypothetical protein
MNLTIIATVALALYVSASVGQVSAPPKRGQIAADDPRLAKLPPVLRDHGRALLEEPDEDKRADLAEALADKDVIGALDFLLAVPTATRRRTCARTSSTSSNRSTTRE